MKPSTFWVIAPLAAGCVIDNDKYARPGDLPPVWRVDELRILGIQATPPEVSPGDTATFQAFVANPAQEAINILWIACPPLDPSDDGCTPDIDGLTPEVVAMADPEDFGVIGFEPGIPPSLTVRADALDTLSMSDRSEGVEFQIQLGVLRETLLEDPPDALDPSELDLAFKRLVVSESSTPNGNPTLTAWTVNGTPLAEQEVAIVAPGEEVTLAVGVTDGSIEDYVFINREGQQEMRTEEPYAVWFATRGTIEFDTGLWPFMDTNWEAPRASGSAGSWFVVVRDRRGGMAWAQRSWRVR